MIKIEHLYKSFNDVEVLRDINFEISKGDVIAIIGPSGTGKSTLLRCMNCLTYPDKGKITINNICVDAEYYTHKQVLELRRQFSMVFQNYNLFKNMTALGNA